MFHGKVRQNGSVCDSCTTRDHVYGRVGEPMPRELIGGGIQDSLVRYDLSIVLGHGCSLGNEQPPPSASPKMESAVHHFRSPLTG